MRKAKSTSPPDEATLLRQLRQFEMAERLGNIGHWSWHVGAEGMDWSPHTFRIHEMAQDPDGVPLDRVLACYVPQDRTALADMLDTVRRDKTPAALEVRLALPNGREKLLRCEADCALSPSGEVRSVFGVIRDITQERETEQQARMWQERQNDFVDVSTDWVWEMGPDLRFTYISDQIETMTGVPASVHIGKTRADLCGDGEPSLEMQMHMNWLEQHRPFRDFRFWRSTPLGPRQYISTSGKPFFDEDGNFAGYRGVGRNLTDFQETKQELIATNRQLNAANKAKSDALSSLKEANAQLEERNAEMQRVQREIEHRALHDPLTGIGNRRFLDERLEQMAAQCFETGAWLGALHIDLDRFKHINDTLGHAAGDAVLRHVADVLQTSVPAGDVVARVGGDEFVVVSTGHRGEEMLGSLAARLIDEFSRPVSYEGRDCWFGASVGIATMRGREIRARQLLVNADVALYRAKREGRGCYTFYTTQLQQEIIDYKAVADGILRGLKRGEFVPWFQPQVCARTFRVVGIEALARWDCPGHGIRPPSDFLETAEDLSAVAAIDRRILEQALEIVEGWRQQGLEVPKLSVNVSSKRLMDTTLVDGLRELKVPPGAVAFELLESVFLDDVDERILLNIDMLKDMGVEVALDDFGSGHASLISLLKLGPDAIKIDRQLVSSITQDEARLHLVRSIIDIGRSLNVRVVAEGVESADAAQVLASMSCDVLQGYFISKPRSAEDMGAFLRDWAPDAFLRSAGFAPLARLA